MILTKAIHYESWRDGSRRSDLEHFAVMSSEGHVDDYENAHVYLVFPLRFLSAISLGETKDVPLVMRLSLDHIRGLVESNTLTQGQTYEFIFTRDDVPDIGRFKWKECAYQQQEKTGSMIFSWRSYPLRAPVSATEKEVGPDPQFGGKLLLRFRG